MVKLTKAQERLLKDADELGAVNVVRSSKPAARLEELGYIRRLAGKRKGWSRTVEYVSTAAGRDWLRLKGLSEP